MLFSYCITQTESEWLRVREKKKKKKIEVKMNYYFVLWRTEQIPSLELTAPVQRLLMVGIHINTNGSRLCAAFDKRKQKKETH